MNPLKDRNEEEVKKALENLEKTSDMNLLEEILKNNIVEFMHADKKYRIRLLSLKEKDELDTLKKKKFSQLLKDKDVLFERTLVELYKEKGIDIADLDKKIHRLESEIESKYMALGNSISKNEGEIVLNTFKDDIEKLLKEKQSIVAEKMVLLENSFENQLQDYIASVITYLVFDIEEDGVWKRLFSTYEEFLACEDQELINKAVVYCTVMQYVK